MNLSGQRFGRLTVIESAGRTPKYAVLWLCKCECGKIVEVITNNLTKGNTKSCGCLHNENLQKRVTKHRNSIKNNVTPEYRAWQSMKGRCYNPCNKRFYSLLYILDSRH